MDTVIHTWLSPLVTRLMECYPALEIELSADTASNLCSQLEKGYQDIIFQTDILRLDSVRNALLTRYPMHWVVRTGSAYDRSYASLEDLSQERIVTFSRNSRPHPGHPQPAALGQHRLATHQLRELGLGHYPPGLATALALAPCPRRWSSANWPKAH